MSTRTTPYLHLVQDNSDEPVKNHHTHANDNLATLDTAIKDLQDAVANLRAVFGDLGIDGSGDPVVSVSDISAAIVGESTWNDVEGGGET